MVWTPARKCELGG